MELLIGKVVKSHGVKGEVAVEVLTDAPEQRFVVGNSLTGRQAGKERELTIKTLRPHQQRLLVSFEEVPDRTAADSLRGMQFFAEPLERDEDDEEYYDHELIGLKVHMGGEEIGEVSGIMDTPNRKILEIDYGGREVLVPFVMDFVPEVDLEAGTLTITPPEGLLDV
ncbi:ribosome maturation factor RimM [Corynebacterium liangguodongii]|uniref:Ribosome maturation factor RimM n=1 Tax=Corynebacterium liangguodongii TaxID=2079535 RepID=A0A2S0WH34_9CORY|nr:ribosome maturation factor RimM [Corynebacterium liangguodongii]AWB85098.1 ribosome maturation factor RimM [Corynebacterium liangguodongii]PWC00336.1 ribosome maturation factor RimM [Corynebacterium liangguodongii]